MITFMCLFLIAFIRLTRSVNETCNISFKVYVYPISEELLKNAVEARQNRTYHICKKCIYEQFALEYIIFDYFTQFCGRTYNPEEADYFYLPIIRDIDYRIALATGGGRAPSIIESALLDAIENNNMMSWKRVFNVTDKYWFRHNGSNHLIVMPAPVTNLRHQSNMRGFFHYMIQLNRPIFINVEYSSSFVTEYPICAFEKNIIVPYPTTDADFYSGRLFLPNYPNIKRDKLVFYQGGHHGSCEAVRSALVNIIKNKQLALYWGEKKREAGFQSAAFCPIPVGDSPSSKRMYDVMNFGCIPVILSDDLVWAYTTELPHHPPHYPHSPHHINVTKFSIHLPQNIVQKTATYMLSNAIKSSQDVNYGQPLPSSGISLFSLLQQIAEEEKSEINSTNSRRKLSVNEDKEALISSKLEVDSELRLVRRILINKIKKLAPPNAKINNKNSVLAGEPTGVNTLVRLLQKIPKEDITQLQKEVMIHANHYRYYGFNYSLPNTAPPLTADNSFPNGGALKQLERMLSIRKQKGIVRIADQCQVERNKKHAYIGRYPCEKRRL